MLARFGEDAGCNASRVVVGYAGRSTFQFDRRGVDLWELPTLARRVTERGFWGIIPPGGEALPVGRLAFKAREGR